MQDVFQKTELKASPFVPIRGNDRFSVRSYNRNMPRRIRHDWYLREWLATAGISQADLDRLTEWGKRKTSELVSGKQRYNREVVNEAAAVLHVAPYELLMHPDDAMAMRQMRGAAEKYVTIAHSVEDDDDHIGPKTGTDD
jgi:hypothetical protein